jgi:hypothetical protein
VSHRLLRAGVALLGLGAPASCVEVLGDVALDVVPDPPSPPELAPPPTPTSSSTAVLRGTRQANTALLLDGEEVAPRGGATAFRLQVPLAPGFNTFLLRAVDAAGRSSDEVAVTIAYDDVAPAPIGFTAAPPSRTARARLDVSATKESACVVWQDGRPRADVAVDGAFFAVDEPLAPGANRFRFSCIDDAGNESAVTQIDVERFERDAIPFLLQEPPAEIAATSLVLSASCGDDIEAEVAGLAATRCTQDGWSAEVPLVPGDNEITVRAAFVGELGSVSRSTTVRVVATAPDGGGGGR